MIQIQIKTPIDYQKQSADFLDIYQCINIILPSASNKQKLKSSKLRTCRFCGRSHATGAKFQNDAHVFPELIGNKFLFSDSECDECNSLFGIHYDNDLANFIGVSRTVQKINAKGKVPTFKNKSLTARNTNFIGKEAIVLERRDIEDEIITNQLDKGRLIINVQKNPYRPINVYKSLLKMAFSILPQAELQHYKHGLSLLQNPLKSFEGTFITGYFFSYNIRFPPHCFLFKKKLFNAEAHTHVFALYCGNLILIAPLILNENDFFFYGREISCFSMPPFFINYEAAIGSRIEPFYMDMTSLEQVRSDQEELHIEFDPEHMKHRFDPVSGIIEHKEFDGNEIVKIVFSDEVKNASSSE